MRIVHWLHLVSFPDSHSVSLGTGLGYKVSDVEGQGMTYIVQRGWCLRLV